VGRIETGWGRGLRVASQDVAISGYPLIGDAHFEIPYNLYSKE
jgi:hypothetical protein